MPIINITGRDLRHLGDFADLAELLAAHPLGSPGDFAIVDGDPASVWVWSEDSNAWENSGTAGSVVSVFGRGGPAIEAEYGDYNTDLIEDNSNLSGATLTDSLNSLEADQHDHDNKTELDLIDQDLSTIADVTHDTITLLGTSTAALDPVDLVTVSHSGTAMVMRIGDGQGYIGTSVADVDALGIILDDVVMLDINSSRLSAENADLQINRTVNGEDGQFLMFTKDDLGVQHLMRMKLDPDTEVFSIDTNQSAFYVDTDTAYIGGTAPISGRQLTVNSASQYIASFNSTAAAGAQFDYMVDGTNEVLNLGSLTAVWGTGTKYDAGIVGQYELHILGLDDVHIQEDTLVVQLGSNQVGVNNPDPEVDLHVLGQLGIGDEITLARMSGFDFGIMDSSAKMALINYNDSTSAALDPMISFKGYNEAGTILRTHWDVGASASGDSFVVQRPGGGDYVMALRADNDAEFNSNIVRIIPETGDAVLELACDGGNDQAETVNSWLSLKQDGATTHAVVGFTGVNDVDMYGDTLTGITANDLIVGHKDYEGLGLMTDQKVHAYITRDGNFIIGEGKNSTYSGEGHTIYLPGVAGSGTNRLQLVGDQGIWNDGAILAFGDGNYASIYEAEDDVLRVSGMYGLQLVSSDSVAGFYNSSDYDAETGSFNPILTVDTFTGELSHTPDPDFGYDSTYSRRWEPSSGGMVKYVNSYVTGGDPALNSTIRRTNGTSAAPTKLLAGNVVLRENYAGHNGLGWVDGARQTVAATNDWANGDNPLTISWEVAKAGAAARTNAFNIKGEGISLNTGATVDTIETTLTDDDTHVPTSGAVFAAIATENLWDRTGTVLSPTTAGDDIYVNKIGVGLASAPTYGIELEAEDSYDAGIKSTVYASDGYGPFKDNYFFRGTKAAPATALDGDHLSAEWTYSYNGSGTGWTAGIELVATADHGAADLGSRYDFWTTPAGTTQAVRGFAVNGNYIAAGLGTSINEFSIDGTLAGNSDDALVTEKAIVTYVAPLFTDQHAHTNKANLDTIDQNMATTDDVTFNSVTVSGSSIHMVDGVPLFDLTHTVGNTQLIGRVVGEGVEINRLVSAGPDVYETMFRGGVNGVDLVRLQLGAAGARISEFESTLTGAADKIATSAAVDTAITTAVGDEMTTHEATYVHTDIALNTTHRGSDGTDHANVVLNDTHRGSDGKDHSDVVLNNAYRGVGHIPLSEKAAVNGVATLDAGGKLLTSQLPALAITDTFVVATEVAQLALTVQVGDVAVRTDEGKSYINQTGNNTSMADWVHLATPEGAILTVNGYSGPTVTLTTSDITEGTRLYYTEARVDANLSVAANTTHRSSDGTDHANVVLNDTHRASDGKDHSDVVLNNAHRTSTGADHSYIDQSVTTGASPTFQDLSLENNGQLIFKDGTDSQDNILFDYDSGIPTVKYGIGKTGTNGLMMYSRSGAFLSFGEMSDSDGTTFSPAMHLYQGKLIMDGGGTGINEFSIDGTLAGNSDDALVTEKAIVTYVAPLFTDQHTHSNKANLDEINQDLATTDAVTFLSVSTDVVAFNTGYTVVGTEPTGNMFWDSDNETVSVALPGGVVGQLFEENFFPVKNDSGGDLPDGMVATYASSIGASGNIRAELTVASASEPAFMTLGILTQTITNGGTGKVATSGKVRGIQTNGANYSETWVDGDILYKSSTVAGGLTKVAPNAPIPAVPIAVVIAAHASNGTLMVRPTYPQALTSLTDVNGTPLTANGQLMLWDNDNGYFDFTDNISNYVHSNQSNLDSIDQDLGTGDAVSFTGITTNDTLVVNNNVADGYPLVKLDAFSNTDWEGGLFDCYRARGTSGTPLDVQVGDSLVAFEVKGRQNATANQKSGIFTADVGSIDGSYAQARWRWGVANSSGVNENKLTVQADQVIVNESETNVDFVIKGVGNQILATDADVRSVNITAYTAITAPADVVPALQVTANSASTQPAIESVTSSTGSKIGYRAIQGGESQPWFQVQNDLIAAEKPGILLGTGGVAADVNLYRDAADVLKTDDAFVALNLTLTTGATVDTIETAVTDDDTHLATSGAVFTLFDDLTNQLSTDEVVPIWDAANGRFVESGMRISDAVLGGTIWNEIVFSARPSVGDPLDGDSWTYYDGVQLWHEKYVDGAFWQAEYGQFTP